MATLIQLPPEFVSLDGLKCLRSVCKAVKSNVDYFLNLPNQAENIYCAVNDFESGMQLSLHPPSFAHTTLVVDIPFQQEFKGFYRLDFESYLTQHAKNIKTLECNWFLGFSVSEEFMFLNAFDGLQELVFQNVRVKPEFELVLKNVPRCILNISSLTSPWSPLFSTLGWLLDPSFKPKTLVFTEIAGNRVVEFFKHVNDHIILRLQSETQLLLLQFDEHCVGAETEFPADLLKDFCKNVIKSQLGLKGVSSVFIYKVEKLLEKKEFVEFLKCLENVFGFHPAMRKLQLNRLKRIEVREDPMKIVDLRWTKQKNATCLPNLIKMCVEIEINCDTFSRNRSTECKTAQNIIDTLLGNECPRLKKLIVKIMKPDWYPLYAPLESYVKNFANLKSLEVCINLSSIQVKNLFEALVSCPIKTITLSNCYLTDESFKDSSFLHLTHLTSFSIRSQNPCTMQFLSDKTFFEVFSLCCLHRLHIRGYFPLITSNGIRFMTYGEKIAETLQSFKFDTPGVSLDVMQAIDSVLKKCEKNISTCQLKA